MGTPTLLPSLSTSPSHATTRVPTPSVWSGGLSPERSSDSEAPSTDPPSGSERSCPIFSSTELPRKSRSRNSRSVKLPRKLTMRTRTTSQTLPSSHSTPVTGQRSQPPSSPLLLALTPRSPTGNQRRPVRPPLATGARTTPTGNKFSRKHLDKQWAPSTTVDYTSRTRRRWGNPLLRTRYYFARLGTAV